MKKLVIYFLLVVFISGFIFAFSQSQVGNPSHEITKRYQIGESIKGWINISLNNEPANSILKTSVGDEINIFDLIKKNVLKSVVNYDCNPNDCQSGYSSVPDSGESIKTFFLNDRESKIIGLRFSGGDDFKDVKDFSMTFDSNAGGSTFRQLFIDIFGDGATEWQSYKASGNFYNEDYGCFIPENLTDSSITTTSFCEKINVPIAPEVEIGAYIKNSANPGATFVFSLDNEKGKSATCEATALSEGRIGCIPGNFKIETPEDYYVCIEAKTADDNFKYVINSETNDVCGYADTKNHAKDFEIFAKPGSFKSVGIFTLNNAEASSSVGGNINLSKGIFDYIQEKYNGDCTDECVVPIRITAGKNALQTITISEVNIKYKLGGEDKTFSNFEIYNLSETSAKITSGFIKLNLDDANFSLQNSFGNKTFSVSLDNVNIFSDSIMIEKVPQIVSLKPPIAIAGVPTEFTVKVNTFNSTTIIKYEREFSNEKKTTTENKTTHTYTTMGTQTVKITITDANGKSSSKTFNIESATSKQAINILLKRDLSYLNSVKSAIGNLSSFEKTSLESVMNIKETEASISRIQQRNATAVSDQDYTNIMIELVNITVPKRVAITKNAESLLFYPDKASINLNILKKIGGGNYGNKEKGYIDSILAWNFANAQTKMNFKEFTAGYDGYDEEILNIFELKINDNPSIDGAYFIAPTLENMIFENNYSKKEIDGHTYIQLNGGESIVFSTTEDIEFTELPVFISPEISRLSVQGTTILDTEKISKQTLLILVVMLVLFVGFILYLIMQQWYKRKYENYLFKNRNDLYNLVSYIQNMKKQGINDKKVSGGLKKTGWSSEQIRYIMRKYYGRGTGMFEIPIHKIINLFKKLGKPKINLNPAARKFNKLE